MIEITTSNSINVKNPLDCLISFSPYLFVFLLSFSSFVFLLMNGLKFPVSVFYVPERCSSSVAAAMRPVLPA